VKIWRRKYEENMKVYEHQLSNPKKSLSLTVVTGICCTFRVNHPVSYDKMCINVAFVVLRR
jgi:cAMP phosphodiesterase